MINQGWRPPDRPEPKPLPCYDGERLIDRLFQGDREAWEKHAVTCHKCQRVERWLASRRSRDPRP